MNKKFLIFGLLGIFAVALVSAIAYYGFFSTTFNVVSAISVSDCSEILEGEYFSGETVIGSECTITNNAPTERVISISNDADENITIEYIGSLIMSKKDLTTWIPTVDTETITYTVVGSTFSVSGVPEGLVAVYYPNKDNYDYYDGVIVLADDVTMNLPVGDDLNGGDDSDYCINGDNPDATQCKGAKLWLIPSNAINDNVIDWNRASEFYFETSLIQYNAEGNIIISGESSLAITPVYTISDYVSGEQTITTTIA